MDYFELDKHGDIRFDDVIVSSWYVISYRDLRLESLHQQICGVENRVLFNVSHLRLGRLMGLFKFNDDKDKITYYIRFNNSVESIKEDYDCIVRSKVRFFVLEI